MEPRPEGLGNILRGIGYTMCQNASMEPRPEGLGNMSITSVIAGIQLLLQWSRGPKASET